GGCHRGEPRRYLREVDTLRGRPRVWVLVAHAIGLYQEDVDLLRYLDTIGVRRDSVTVPSRLATRPPPPASAVPHRLSDARRLAGAEAATADITGNTVIDPRLACDAGPHTLIPSDFP